jgi:hypothetical protein
MLLFIHVQSCEVWETSTFVVFYEFVEMYSQNHIFLVAK